MNDGSSSVVRKIYAYLFFSKGEGKDQLLNSLIEAGDKRAIILKEMYDKTGEIISYSTMVNDHGLDVACKEGDVLSFTDLLSLVTTEKRKGKKDKVLSEVLEKAQKENLTGEEVFALIGKLGSLVEGKVERRGSLREQYSEEEKRPRGLLTFFPEIDDRIKGVPKGTVLTIAGFVGSMKTTTAINILYRNCVELKLNGVMWTTEVPRYLLGIMLLVRHAYNPKFTPSCGVPTYQDVQKCTLTEEQKEFMFGVVEKDLYTNPEYGKFILYEDSDFDSRSVQGVEMKLAQLGWEVDFFILDHVNNLKYMKEAKGSEDVANHYVRGMSELAKNYMRGKGLSVVLLMQTNRDGWNKAVENDGEYDLKALAEVNEAERSSSFVMALFVDEDLKESGEMKYQLLKNRFGRTLVSPSKIEIKPEYYVIGRDAQSVVSVGDAVMDDILGDFLGGSK